MRHRVLTEGCEWILDGKTFNSDQALDLYIQTKIREGVYSLKNGHLHITQSVDLQTRAVNIINDIQQKISGVAEMVTPESSANITRDENPEEAESYLKIRNSIGVNNFLRMCPKPGSIRPYVQPFVVRAWREYTTKKLIASGKTQEEAEAITKRLEDTWPELTNLGIEVHKVFEQIFNGEVAIKQNNSKLTDSQFHNLVRQVEELKRSILNKYQGAKIYTELGIISKDLSQQVKEMLAKKDIDSINGKIDLLVIDKQGNAHIYDFKVSRKNVGE